jgi:hypothetical protein
MTMINRSNTSPSKAAQHNHHVDTAMDFARLTFSTRLTARCISSDANTSAPPPPNQRRPLAIPGLEPKQVVQRSLQDPEKARPIVRYE